MELYYKKKGIRLIHGDCFEAMHKLKDNIVDLTVTSPPYDNLRTYNNSCDWDFEMFKCVAKELYRITKRGGVVAWIVGDATIKGSETGTSFKQALYFKEIGFNLYDTELYVKQNFMPLTHRRYEQAFEYMFILTKGRPKAFNPIKVECKYAGCTHASSYHKDSSDKLTKVGICKTHTLKQHSNIFTYVVGALSHNYKHPAPFPEQLAIDHVLSWSNPGDIIFDPFAGSGTTGIAAFKNGRRCILIEKVKDYCDIIVKRFSECEGKDD